MEYKNEPLVSIIIPTFNREELLSETLRSVQMQSYKNWECIVVDDGSTDKTIEMVESFASQDNRYKIFLRPNRFKGGGNGARNYGLELAKGNFVNWFDSDDIMLPNFLQDRIEIKKGKLAISNYKIVDEKLNDIKTISFYLDSNYWEDYVLWKENFRILTPSILFPREFIDKNNIRFNEDFVRGQEAELISKILYEVDEKEICIINKPGFLYRQHVGSKTGENKKYNARFRYDAISYQAVNLERSLKKDNLHVAKHFYAALVGNLILGYAYSKDNFLYAKDKLDILMSNNKKWKIKLRYLKFLNISFKMRPIVRYLMNYKVFEK